MKNYKTNSRIHCGEGALDRLLLMPGDKAVVVTDLPAGSELFRAVASRLAENYVEYTVFSGIDAAVSVEAVREGSGLIFDKQPSLLIALGSSAAIDAAKAMLYFCRQQKNEMKGMESLRQPALTVILTNCATGLEATAHAEIYDAGLGVSIPLSYHCMIPKAVILDPYFMKSLSEGASLGNQERPGGLEVPA